jgi:hypothetical protein
VSVLEQRVFRTVTGAHVADGHLDADVLAYAIGDDVPDEVLAELGDTVTLAPAPAPVPDPEPEPVAAPRGSRVRVFRTEAGRHVRAGHREAAVLAYTEEDDVPDEVLAELDAPAPDEELDAPAPDEELDAPAPEPEPAGVEQKAAPAAANKSRKPAADKAGGPQ